MISNEERQNDYEGADCWKLFVPLAYILNWALLIFGSLLFPEAYQIFCFVVLIFFDLRLVGLGIGSAYSIYKLNQLTSEPQTQVNQVVGEGEEVYHAIVIPNYKEEEGILKSTLDKLSSHDLAKTSYLVFLGMEKHEVDHQTKAQKLIQAYKQNFRHMGYTAHVLQEGQAKGKASNVTWCVKHMMENVNLTEEKQVMVTVIDADSWAPNKYFIEVNRYIRSHPEDRHQTIFSPPQIFTRNNTEVPIFTRVYDVMNTFLHLSNLASWEFSFPFSNYTLSLELIKSVGYWDTCPDAIAEDMHTTIKCYWKTSGVKTVPIYVPFNQFSLMTGEGYCSDVRARFWQAERHGRAVTEASYCLNMLCKTPFVWKKCFLTLSVLETFLITAFVPWATLIIGIHYKIVPEEQGIHYFDMVFIDILLNITVVINTLAYFFYEIFKRTANKKIWNQENESLLRVLEYPIFFIVVYIGMCIPAFILSSFGVVCTKTEYRVAEKVQAKENQPNNKIATAKQETEKVNSEYLVFQDQSEQDLNKANSLRNITKKAQEQKTDSNYQK